MTDPGVAEEVSVRYRELFDVSTRKKSEDHGPAHVAHLLIYCGLAAVCRFVVSSGHSRAPLCYPSAPARATPGDLPLPTRPPGQPRSPLVTLIAVT